MTRFFFRGLRPLKRTLRKMNWSYRDGIDAGGFSTDRFLGCGVWPALTLNFGSLQPPFERLYLCPTCHQQSRAHRHLRPRQCPVVSSHGPLPSPVRLLSPMHRLSPMTLIASEQSDLFESASARSDAVGFLTARTDPKRRPAPVA